MDHLKECFASLYAMDYKSFRTLLVDNGSSDESVDFTRSFYPNIEIIENESNIGFSAGINKGIQHALMKKADYVALLNNDTVVDKRWLTELVNHSERDSKVGVVGGTVFFYDNRHIINSTGLIINKLGYAWDRDFGENISKVQRTYGAVVAVSGVGMLIKTKLFSQIGALDEKFFCYYEDADFCVRTWRDSDYKVQYVPTAKIYHKFSSTAKPPFKLFHMTKNQYKLLAKHFPLSQLWAALMRAFFENVCTRGKGHIRRGEIGSFGIELLAVFFFFTTLHNIIFYRIKNRGIKKREWNISEMLLPSCKPPNLQGR
ncbi:MAG: glycosyltransferase family 2 protein [Methanomassiliicoccales archaeon]|nr:MAG: glycosyltransferase family 2 protein [Methanomassiliicoccales archaeon]